MELLFVLHMRPQPPSVHGCEKSSSTKPREGRRNAEANWFLAVSRNFFFVPTAFIDITAIYPRSPYQISIWRSFRGGDAIADGDVSKWSQQVRGGWWNSLARYKPDTRH